MTTIVIKSNSIAAKRMIDFLKTQSYARVVESEVPNSKTAKAIQNAIAGKNLSKSYSNTDELFKAFEI
jgi:hypothetical protein